jgi:hypothetical protein
MVVAQVAAQVSRITKVIAPQPIFIIQLIVVFAQLSVVAAQVAAKVSLEILEGLVAVMTAPIVPPSKHFRAYARKRLYK